MGKHAAPRTSPLRSRTAQRAAAVSAGTFMLCLGAAAPALAAAGPTPTPPIPQPVQDVVQVVSHATGLPNPIADPAKATHKHRHHQGAQTTKPQLPVTHQTQTARPVQHHQAVARPTNAPTSFAVPALRSWQTTRTEALTGRAPAMAHTPTVTRIVQAARENVLPALTSGSASEDTLRILVVALAMTIVGGLASGHIKAAQQRSVAW